MSKDEIRIITKKGEIITADSPIWRWEISEKIGHSGVNLEDPNVSEVEKEKFVKSIHDIAISYNIEPDELLKAVKIVAKESQHVPWFGCTPGRHTAFVPISKSILEKEKAQKINSDGNKKYKSKDYKGALDDYEEAILKDPTNSVYYSNKANALS